MDLTQYIRLLKDQKFRHPDDFETWYRAQSMLRPDKFKKDMEELDWAYKYLSWCTQNRRTP